MKRRRGVSLIELIVLMTAISTILSFTVVILHRTMRAHNRAQATHADEQSAWRLSEALRRDVVEAIEAKAEQDPQATLLTIRSRGGGLVRYRFGPLAVNREQERSVDGRSTFEEYTFGGPTAWGVEVLDSPKRLVVQTVTDPMERTRAIVPIKMRVMSRLRGDSFSSGVTP